MLLNSFVLNANQRFLKGLRELAGPRRGDFAGFLNDALDFGFMKRGAATKIPPRQIPICVVL
jgi:hypothetical protein